MYVLLVFHKFFIAYEHFILKMDYDLHDGFIGSS
jgi:hypothetical protein